MSVKRNSPIYKTNIFRENLNLADLEMSWNSLIYLTYKK